MAPNKPLAERLREAAQEIASEGHNGWGNLMIEAAYALDPPRDESCACGDRHCPVCGEPPENPAYYP